MLIFKIFRRPEWDTFRDAGETLGAPVDLFAPFIVAPTKRLSLGEVDLSAGTIPLILEITGKHPRAVPGYIIGLDYVRLVRRS